MPVFGDDTDAAKSLLYVQWSWGMLLLALSRNLAFYWK